MVIRILGNLSEVRYTTVMLSTSFLFTDTVLFLCALVISYAWFRFHDTSVRCHRVWYWLTIAYLFLAVFLISYWSLVEHIDLTIIPFISLGIVACSFCWAALQYNITAREVLLSIVVFTFPVVLVSLATESLFFGDLWLTALFYIIFFTSGFTVLYLGDFRFPYWIGGVSIFILGFFRFVGGAQWGVRSVENINYILLFFVTAFVSGCIVVLWSKREMLLSPQPMLFPRWVDGLVLAGLLFLTIILTTTKLSGLSFQNDEYYHVNAATGYLEEGKFVEWDYQRDAVAVNDKGVVLEYDRASVYTLQVAAAFSFFGVSESAARLPSLIWFIFFIVGAFVVIRKWTGDLLFSTLLVGSFVFVDHFILHARLSRMYSMLLFVTSASLLSWYYLFRFWLEKKIRWQYVIPLFFITVGLSVLGYFTHLLYLTIFPLLFVFVVIEFIRAYAVYGGIALETRRISHWLLAGVLSIFSVVFMTVFDLIGFTSRFALRSTPNFQYEIIPFSDMAIPLLAMVMFFIGIFLFFQKSRSYRYIAIFSFGVIILYTFGIRRYNAIRYILFLMPVILIVSAYALYYGLVALYSRISSTVVRSILIVFTFVLLFTPFAWPGVPVFGGMTYLSRADRIHENEYGHNYRDTYAYIKSQRAVDDILFAQSFRSVYWGVDKSLQVYDLGEQKSLTRSDLKKMMKGKKGWFVWANGKTHHLKKKVVQYIRNNSIDLSATEKELRGTNMQVYYFDLTGQ